MSRLKSISIFLYSLLFCLRYLPFKQAIKVPIYISRKVRIEKLKKGDIVFACEPMRSMVVIGFEGTKGLEQQKAVIYVEDGKIVFRGYTTLLAGNSINIVGGTLSFGNGVICNDNCYYYCFHSDIEIDEDTFLGWNVTIFTTSGHHVIIDGIEKGMNGNVSIGRHVWVCAYSHISKNVRIADGCIVAQGSLVLKDQLTPNSLIAGNPAKKIKENVDWSI